MNPILKVLLVTSLICFSLYLAVIEFLGSTSRLQSSLDMKALRASLRAESEENPKPGNELAIVLKSLNTENSAPERDEDMRIDVNTVSARSQRADNDIAELAIAEPEVNPANTVSSTETRLKRTLGIREPPPPVRAVDVALEIASECDSQGIVLAPLSVKYRHESPTIKGSSLSELEFLVAEYRKCEGGVFRFSPNPLGKEDSTPALMQRRFDELKYFFLQHRVPKTALRFPDNP